MLTRSKSLIIILITLLVFLSACSPDANVSPAGDDLDAELSESDAASRAEEGSATVYYHYLVNHEHVKIKTEPVLGIDITAGDTPGSFDVTGIGQTWATLEMAAGVNAVQCWIKCEILLRYTVNTKLELDEVNGDCKIPMSFTFVATDDESILTGDCPEQLMAVTSCAALSAVMIDPSIYTFTKEIRDLHLPSDPTVTMKAEIREVKMPRGTEGICNW